jgi:hypothetical protein
MRAQDMKIGPERLARRWQGVSDAGKGARRSCCVPGICEYAWSPARRGCAAASPEGSGGLSPRATFASVEIVEKRHIG